MKIVYQGRAMVLIGLEGVLGRSHLVGLVNEDKGLQALLKILFRLRGWV